MKDIARPQHGNIAKPARQTCPHCHSTAPLVQCCTCTREMCEDCISYGQAGKMCGLCLDSERQSLVRESDIYWLRPSNESLDFEPELVPHLPARSVSDGQ